jgi:diadenosine tetraphosphate (Ap4A) HIT family hydrolase
MTTCELCTQIGGSLLWQSGLCRIVRVNAPEFPGYCRIIWNQHVAEMSDLTVEQQTLLLAIVVKVEETVRELFEPDKINLASLGNMTPHLHWHVIPRWRDDPLFPESIWGTPQRSWDPQRSPRREVGDATLAAALVRLLGPSD